MKTLCIVIGMFLWAVVRVPAQGLEQGKYPNLAFDEDWSFLSEPGVETAHWFPALKQIEIGDGWMLDLGGQERLRYQSEENKSLRGTSPNTNDFALIRTRVHADFRHESGFRVFVELLDARVAGNDRPPLSIDRQNVDVQNAFVEYAHGKNLWRAGRMELSYGKQRLASPLDWANTRRRFQGLLMRNGFDGGSVDSFVTRFVPVDPRDTDYVDDSLWFSGVYATFPDAEGGGVDVFGLTSNETANKATNGNGNKGSSDTYTLGARWWVKSGPIDAEAWGAHQFGQWAGDSIDASALSTSVGYTDSELAGKPRLALDVDWASGDSNPTDDEHETFQQLYPLGHAYFGALDLVGRQNIIDVQPNLTVAMDDRSTLKIEQHFFKLAERRDALYNAGGAATLRDTTGGAGTDVGRELDVILTRRLESLAPHGIVQVGWAQFTPGDFVETLGSTKHTTLLYLQFVFNF